MRNDLGRHVFGLAFILFGIITVVWHSFNGWQQIEPLGNIPRRAILAYIVAAVEILGGLAIQWPKMARPGAIALGCISLLFALLWVPRIAAQPLVYDGWGNFFEQFSQVAGALIVYATFAPTNPRRGAKIARVGYICFGICVISFTLEQLFNLSATASFVPRWIPPGQMFWAITTTICLGLAAVALLSRHVAVLASRLLTAMIVGFGLLVWLPQLGDPHKLFNWAGNAENLAIAGTAWIVADYLSRLPSPKTTPTASA